MDLSQIIIAVFSGITTGFGTAIGSYLATKHLIDGLNKVKEKLKNNEN